MLLVMILYINLYQLDFLIDWEPCQDHEGRKKYGSKSRVEKIKNIFLQQTKRLMCQVIWVFLLTATLVILGFVGAKTGYIGCSSDGKKWQFKN